MLGGCEDEKGKTLEEAEILVADLMYVFHSRSVALRDSAWYLDTTSCAITEARGSVAKSLRVHFAMATCRSKSTKKFGSILGYVPVLLLLICTLPLENGIRNQNVARERWGRTRSCGSGRLEDDFNV